MRQDPVATVADFSGGQPREAQIRALIVGNYLPFQYRFVEFLTAHLADCSRVFKGDLQTVLLLAVIGQVALEGRNASGKRSAKQENLTKEGGISAHRLSDITGIPRQTVRRKLEAMENKGWIYRDPSLGWRLALAEGAAAVRKDLSGLDARSLVRWAHLLSTLEPLLLGTVEIPAQNEHPTR